MLRTLAVLCTPLISGFSASTSPASRCLMADRSTPTSSAVLLTRVELSQP